MARTRRIYTQRNRDGSRTVTSMRPAEHAVGSIIVFLLLIAVAVALVAWPILVIFHWMHSGTARWPMTVIGELSWVLLFVVLAIVVQNSRIKEKGNASQNIGLTTNDLRRLALTLVALLAALSTVVVLAYVNTHNSYNDGWAWGSNHSGNSVGCTQPEMAGIGAVDESTTFQYITGDGKPGDNFTQWNAGCVAGVKSVPGGSLGNSGQGNTGSTGSGNTGNTGNTF
jgi:hypothetical protein